MNSGIGFTANKHYIKRSQISQKVIYILTELLLRVYLVCQKVISNLRTIYKYLFYPVKHWNRLVQSNCVRTSAYMFIVHICETYIANDLIAVR
jgi:flagellin-specific chaperone FliS